MFPLTLKEKEKKAYTNQIWSDFWRDSLAVNKSLLHVDFSHNNLTLQDVEGFAEGLRTNQ